MAKAYTRTATALLLVGLAICAPTPLNSVLTPRDAPAGWTYSGCRTDNVNNQRTLIWQLILQNTNSVEACISSCQSFGYDAAGMEYGSECYCGDASAVQAGQSTSAPETDCNVPCSGNAAEICGAGSRLSYYTYTATPALYTWHTPTGNQMGQYQYLITSPVVALIATMGVNGKVQFLEKYGTSPTQGSTGAYELDLAEVGNPNAAWRTMHLKTDVFCSAALVLPDKAGRQINVGGWAEESVYGIRLYWPDGSPGQPSANDWQENYDELHLQSARWYPTAMILANGSIMVVGGEIGSNAAASPTIEVLPRPDGAGQVYCDFLARTDPNNLYPFLVVLPSGGIFIAYANEARVLDEVTFGTTKTLPNMPGTVNNPVACRTYPCEGTAMIMPQVAPYTDPLTILVCGGTSIGPYDGEAIDSCVSAQPDAANPTWTLERMPSKRVLSCMVALPDGTYIILNGAHQGKAGFGLAEDANYQAVLYDPSQPVNSRMSIMASSTIARMYHSEAILLQDGRVLVSGSDPLDTENEPAGYPYPEEHRIEVFLPPYLLSGAAQPSVTASSTDWGYGESIALTINIPTGNAQTVRFSLMGAVSSTHGNSMGQRTIFPAFTCSSATSCTVTAPPNAHVCPPGWFMLFVLDGPTPSHGVWVRIGGDPAELGNWPNAPDFKVPGV